MMEGIGRQLCFYFLIIPFMYIVNSESSAIWDQNGYVMYCPCMGRLGNQLEQFLGALRFAKNLNRTMVVPPWIAYDFHADTSFTPYSTWFDIKELEKFHRVMPMRTFIDDLSSEHWPIGSKSRKIYCPVASTQRSPDSKSCPAKIGNPFGPFWDSFQVDFTGGSEVYHYGELAGYTGNAKAWDKKFPPNEHPVIALMGAPGSFPIDESNRVLQKYIKWSDNMLTLAEDFIATNLERPYVGIHLRNGIDWVRACKHISDDRSHFMGSPQCCGYEKGTKRHKLTHDMCLPSKEAIIKKVKEVAQKHNAVSIFIATDSDAMLSELAQTGLKLVKYDTNYPIADLALLAMSDAFIGNCVSTFTSFVIRHREVQEKPNYFFAFDHPHTKIIHEEL